MSIPAIYNVSSPTQVFNITPPDLRKDVLLQYMYALLQPYQDQHDFRFTFNSPTASNTVTLRREAMYNSQKVVFEWFLNEKFGGTFIQPGAGLSTIYITNNFNLSEPIFLFNNNEHRPVFTYNNTELKPLFLYNNSEFYPAYDFTVHITTALFNTLAFTASSPAALDANRRSILQKAVDKYKIYPLKNNIVLY